MTAAALFDMVTINKDVGFEGSNHPLLEWIQANYEIIFLTALSAGIGIIQQYSQILLHLYVLIFALYRILTYLLAFIIIGFAATTENGKTSTQYSIDGRLYLLDDLGLPLRVKSLSNAHLQPTVGVNHLDYSKNSTYPVLDKTVFEQAKAAAEARQFTPVIPILPDLQIGGQLLQDQN